jgi:phosphomannomutase
MGKYFGTDGFRGEAGITLTAYHAYKVGRFLGGITTLCVSATATTSLRAL